MRTIAIFLIVLLGIIGQPVWTRGSTAPTVGSFFAAPVQADPLDNDWYTVRYEQGGDGLWRMVLSANHPFEIARLGAPFELEQGFNCEYEAVNHFYALLGRLNHFTIDPFPPPPRGC